MFRKELWLKGEQLVVDPHMRTYGPIRSVLISALLIAVVGTGTAFAGKETGVQHPFPEALVTRVNDGDTVTLSMNNRTFRTRLIGIDAPESGQEPWGWKATEHLRHIMKTCGNKVFVEMDITTYDKYDRLLVYLWLSDEHMINEQMVNDGYAVLFTIQPNSKYADRFEKAQHRAQQAHLGIWGPQGMRELPIEYRKLHPREP